MPEKKYGEYIKSLSFQDYGEGYYRQGVRMDGEFLCGLNTHIQYGVYLEPGKMGEAHRIDLKAQTGIHTNFKSYINILGSYGNMNTDAGGGLATGWTNSGTSSLSIVASYLGAGYGNAQRFSITGAGQGIY